MIDKEDLKRWEALIRIVKELGWEIAVPQQHDQGADIKGLIIGEQSYIDYVLKHLEQ